jgi:hypothetical protein
MSFKKVVLGRGFFGFIVFAVSLLQSPKAWTLESGSRLAVGGDGSGPMSAGLSTYPLGMVHLPGRDKPTLFVVAGRFSHEPGLFAFDWSFTTSGPILGEPVAVRYPYFSEVRSVAPPPGLIFQTRGGQVYGFWIQKGSLFRTRYDASRSEFVELPVPPVSIDAGGSKVSPRANPDGRSVERIGILERSDGSLLVILSIPDETVYLPKGFGGRRDPNFDPYDGRGMWRGGLPRVFLHVGTLSGPEAQVSQLSSFRKISPKERGGLFSHGSLTFPDFGSGEHLVTGSYLGNLFHYRLPSLEGEDWPEANLIRGTNNLALRNSFVWTSPVAVADSDGVYSGLAVGGEGALQYFSFDQLASDGVPVYNGPEALKVQNALLYTGSLPVVNSVDWDADGATDLVVGNSEGHIVFFRNEGTTAEPDFRTGEALKAGGRTIHIQPGYAALQGPDESRWGYVSPVVVDWDGDGLPDILSSDARAMHYLFKNTGKPRSPVLASAEPLFCDGLDVHGTWRVRPGVARLGSEMAYVALDSEDQFHLYWRIDDVNLRDGGKLRLKDGAPIGANFIHAGGTGRTKFTLADWDGDGLVDILVGTPRHGSVPNPVSGLPQSLGLPGAAVLWLKNVGSNKEPLFEFPCLMHFKGQPVFFGQHACSLALTDLGGEGGPHVLVGDEEGRIHYFRREDISWGP